MRKVSYRLAVANYSDYRDFLKARFDELKAGSPKFSLLYCAKRSGISKSLLQFVLQKKRHIALDRLPGLIKILRLSKEEEAFLYLLATKNTSKSPHIKLHFESILGKIRHESIHTDLIPPPENTVPPYESFYDDTVAMSLHTLTRVVGFSEDPDWVLKNLKIPGLTAERIGTTLKTLEKKGALKRDEKGILRPTNFPFMRPDPLMPKSFEVYRKGVSSLSHLMQDAEEYQPSVYMLLSFAYDEERLALAEKAMVELHHRLRSLSLESVAPTATVFSGNFFLTLSRFKS